MCITSLGVTTKNPNLLCSLVYNSRQITQRHDQALPLFLNLKDFAIKEMCKHIHFLMQTWTYLLNWDYLYNRGHENLWVTLFFALTSFQNPRKGYTAPHFTSTFPPKLKLHFSFTTIFLESISSHSRDRQCSNSTMFYGGNDRCIAPASRQR